MQEAEKMKAKLLKERTSVQKMKEYTTRLADLQCREEQMKAYSTANIEKVLVTVVYYQVVLKSVRTQLRFITSFSHRTGLHSFRLT